MARRGALKAGLLAVLILVAGTHVSAAPQPGRLSFSVVGDFAASGNTAAVLDGIRTGGDDFTMTLGDLSYGTAGEEQAWCDFVTSRVGAGYPFELLAGNHESNGLNGNINDFSACLPNQLPGAVGTYGKQYYVDVPAENPIARFVMISPSLGFPDGTYAYPAGSARYQWTAQAIDGARAASIPWVVVGMHKPCITVGKYGCDVGSDLFNLLLSKKVDLILSGHEHTYQRSHQLGLRPGCPTLTPGTFDADCVADTGTSFTAGAGSVAMVVGTGGVGLYEVNAADSEAGYFAKTSGTNDNPTWGALRINATDDTLQASFRRASGGTLSDEFTITRPVNPVNTPPVASFTSACADLTCSFDATGSHDADGSVSGYTWDFGDGTSATGPTVTHPYTSGGSYTVGLTVTDNFGATAQTTRNVTATPPASTVYVSDQFSRTISPGLGSAPVGGPWSFPGGPSGFSVVNGLGSMAMPKGGTLTANLATVSAPATDLKLTFGLDKPVTGSGLYLSAHGRRVAGQGSYLGKVRISSTGAAFLEIDRAPASGGDVVLQPSVAVSGLTYAVGDSLNLRLQTTGSNPTTIRAKVWKAGAPEPSGWSRSVTDSTAGLQAPGAVGLAAYLSGSATNAPLAVKLDELTVTSP